MLWLELAADCEAAGGEEGHGKVDCSSWARRRAARNTLKLIDGAAHLFDLEVPKDNPEEDSELEFVK